ncbi:hypothetical protein KR018_001104 [Drosophila ironensis]|nr:hypothetical protein KR018_001104 [Drosophila ironensis]
MPQVIKMGFLESTQIMEEIMEQITSLFNVIKAKNVELEQYRKEGYALENAPVVNKNLEKEEFQKLLISIQSTAFITVANGLREKLMRGEANEPSSEEEGEGEAEAEPSPDVRISSNPKRSLSPDSDISCGQPIAKRGRMDSSDENRNSSSKGTSPFRFSVSSDSIQGFEELSGEDVPADCVELQQNIVREYEEIEELE